MFHSTSFNTGNSNFTRPHSKTTVIGPSLKTRLQCNHLRPKCKCSNDSNKNKSHKTKHTVPKTTSQRRVLSSSRSLPRGETNGRKIYHRTEESVSICDATWQPNLNSNSEGKPNSNIENEKYRNVGDKVIKKKLRFRDQITESEDRHSLNDIPGSDKNMNKSQNQDEVNLLSSHGPFADSRVTGSGSEREKETSRDCCKLCENTEKECANDCYRKRKQDEVLCDSNNSSEFPYSQDFLSSKENNEVCFICHRSKHIKNCDNYCKICDTHIYSYGSQENATGGRQSRNPRNPPKEEEQQIPAANILYRPRTKFVESLKEKLETTYRSDVHNGNKGTSEGTESSKGSQWHLSSRDHMHPGKKCLHRYQQNDRLFLEPTITDRKGQSICGECGVAQPNSPQKDPFVYHITLGGMESMDGKWHNGSGSRFPHRDKENGTDYPNRFRRKSNDPAKLMYAKLNYSIDNLFWRKDLHSNISRHSGHKNCPASLQSKRHPSKSMALIDHII